MSCSDPIADALTIIRNGVQAGKSQVDIPHSKIKEGLCSVLKDEGYLTRVEVVDTQPRRTLQVHLKYADDGESAIHEIKRVSRPGRRVYSGKSELKPIIGGFGITVLSTSRGVLSDRACREANIGGEVLCVVR